MTGSHFDNSDVWDAFLAFSARLGKNRLRVQGPGGNTSIKADGQMWIKASGTELADALVQPIFVEVDHAAALAEANGAGDGSCKDTVINSAIKLRPSIETTFHAALDWPVVAHTHSILSLSHIVSPQGRAMAADKLAGMNFTSVPYVKPGRDLTYQIMKQVTSATNVILLENHGLICCGGTVEETELLMDEVEARLAVTVQSMAASCDAAPAPGYDWVPEVGRLATDPDFFKAALAGSYYPDHVVFLGPGLPSLENADGRPSVLVEGHGVLLKSNATASQRAMLFCLADMFSHQQNGWEPECIGIEAEAELLNWDAEKYRQELARKGGG